MLRSAGMKGMQARAHHQVWPNSTASKTKLAQKQFFDFHGFLLAPSTERKVVEYGSKVTLFRQGDPAASVLYVHKGAVKLAVVNEAGKEAVVAILGLGDFLGEGCLAGQSLRANTAVTITRSTILVIEKREMIRMLDTERGLSERFINHMLSRNIRIEEDLADQLCNSSEKRLARTLLLLARNGKQNNPGTMVPYISQETLAEMVGTTRSRVNFFMNKFKGLGFIEYGIRLRGLQINKSLLSTILRD